MKNKPEELIPEKIREFLKTPEGKQFFSEISECETRQQKYDRLQTFLRVPENVRRWLLYLSKLKKRLDT